MTNISREAQEAFYLACKEIIDRCVAPDMHANAMSMLDRAMQAGWPASAAVNRWEPGMAGTVFVKGKDGGIARVHESQVPQEKTGKFDKFDPT